MLYAGEFRLFEVLDGALEVGLHVVSCAEVVALSVQDARSIRQVLGVVVLESVFQWRPILVKLDELRVRVKVRNFYSRGLALPVFSCSFRLNVDTVSLQGILNVSREILCERLL